MGASGITKTHVIKIYGNRGEHLVNFGGYMAQMADYIREKYSFLRLIPYIINLEIEMFALRKPHLHEKALEMFGFLFNIY